MGILTVVVSLTTLAGIAFKPTALEGIASCAVTGAFRCPSAATHVTASTLATAFAAAPEGAARAHMAQRRGGERDDVRSERIWSGRQRS